MNLYVEVLIIAVPIIIFIAWWLWYRITTRRAYKKYNPDNDKARQGEEKRRRECLTTKAALSNAGPAEPQKSGVLATAGSNVLGKNKHRFRNLLQRRKN